MDTPSPTPSHTRGRRFHGDVTVPSVVTIEDALLVLDSTRSAAQRDTYLGNFANLFTSALWAADSSNLARFEKGWPGVVAALRLAREHDGRKALAAFAGWTP